MYNYDYLNNCHKRVSFKFKDGSIGTNNGDKFRVIIDDSAPTDVKVELAKTKKSFIDSIEMIKCLMKVRNLLDNIPYKVEVISSAPAKTVEEKIVEKAEVKVDAEVTPAPVVNEVKSEAKMRSISITEFDPVMHVGGSQRIRYELDGFDEGAKPEFISSNNDVVRCTRAGRLSAMSVGESYISIKLDDIVKTVRVEVLDLTDLQVEE